MSLRPGLGATYRLQLRPDFGFTDAARIVPYLARLGIETLYLSPIAEAVPLSSHGYDGTDPTRLRAELGGDAGYGSLVDACERHELGICVDHVPNHLSTWPGGGWWRRLLAEGPGSEMGDVFDVDWEAGEGKVVLPMLDRPVDAAIADGTVRSRTRDGQPVVCVGELDLPVAAGSEGADLGVTLGAQHYRLADWHDPDGRNYRRFFDIDGLVGVRLEDPAVLACTQALVVELARSGRLSALRIDHIDGLRRPTEYLGWLASETGVPIVVEKILTGDERPRADWPVMGTTGYETIDDVGGVLVDPHGLDRLVAAGQAEGDAPVEPLTVETRRLVAESSFSAEIRASAARLGVDPEHLCDVVTRLPRYRTYLDTTAGPGMTGEGAGEALTGEGAEPALRHELDETAVWRSLRTPDSTTAEDEVVDVLLEPAKRPEALRVQQLTGALMAKGVEDTAWFRLAGPLAFCEVGGDPARRRHDALARWHDRASGRAAWHLHGLVPGTTHDTKHSQDVRSRLYALSEMADPFEEGLRALRTELGIAGDGGDLSFESFETRVAVQLALGVLPPFDGEPAPGDAGSTGSLAAKRLGDALVKGAREAKWRSSWTAPDQAYEARLQLLAEQLLADRGAVLRRSFGPVLDEVLRLGALNSLTSVVIRHTLPGVPDCYQGDEVWNLSLVDPDNRRPVDFGAMSESLDFVYRADGGDGGDGGDVAGLRRSWRDGRVKLHVTASCLRARRGPGAAALAADADYVRLAASGPAAGSLLTYARRARSASGAESWAVVVVSRLGGRLEAVGDDLPAGPSYEGTVIPLPEDVPEVFSDAICGHRILVRGEVLEVEDALVSLPVALLVAGPG